MKMKTLPPQQVSGAWTKPRPGLTGVAATRIVILTSLGASLVTFLTGCSPPPDRRDIPPAEVKVVQAYGITLDDSATPQQVVYVLLRSIADDVRAAQSYKRDEQKAAFRITHNIGAYTTIEKRLVDVWNATRTQKRDTLGADRDEQIYDFIRQWAPIVSHYVPSFDTDFDAASKKMRTSPPGEGSIHVYYDAAHDPASPADPDKVIIDVELMKETAGAHSYWRVARIGYLGRPSTVPHHTTTQPATTAAR